MAYFEQRREALIAKLRQDNLDAHLISSPVNVSYLTGFSGEASHLVLGKERTILVSDARFTEQLAEECPGLEVEIRPPTRSTLAVVADVLKRLGHRLVGFETGALTVADFESLRNLTETIDWRGISDWVEGLRQIKDETEIAQIREAIDIAERAYTAFCAMLRPEDSEMDLCDAMEHFVRRAGGKSTCFPSIIAVGPRAALPHAPPTTRRVQEGELLLVDWGATGRFYKSDLTRVLDTRTREDFPATGRSRLEAIHEVVAQAQQNAIAAIRPGVAAEDIDAAARKVIADAGYAGAFGHGLGHGIGLQVHEGPALRPGSKTILRPGMVFTIEPGIYLPGWGGIRIEDDVLVTPDGCEVLTHLRRELIPIFRQRASDRLP